MNAGADAGMPGIGAVCASLFVILALLALAAWLLRRLQAQGWVKLNASGAINIVASRRVGFASALLIVEAEGQRFLVGSSRSGVTGIGRLGGGDAP
jgi:flagellar biogenesis protein FliO